MSPPGRADIADTGLPLGILLGQFKDEVNGAQILSFNGLSPKCYEIKYQNGAKVEFITKIRGFQLQSELALNAMTPGKFSNFTDSFKRGVFQSAMIPQFRFQRSKVRKLRAEVITKALKNDTYNKRAIVKHSTEDFVINFTLPYGFSKEMLDFYQALDLNLLNEG